MPANVALNGTELASLAKVNQLAPYYLSFKKENTIATATVATTPTGSSYAQLAVSGVSNWSNIREGMTAKITDSTATVLRGYYRVRRSSGSSISLLIEEITSADAGIITASVRTSGIIATDLITVTDRFDLFSMKPNIANGTLYQDYDIALGTYNTKPEVIVNVAINSRPGDYVTKISSDGGTQHISAAISIVKWPTSSGSTVTYAWVVPASWTNVTGAATATLAADVPPGDYTLYCDVSDSIGGQTEIARWVRIHSPSDPPLGVNITSDTRDMSTRKVSIRAIQAVISSLPPGIKCALWSDATWGGDDVATATRTFVGYLYQQPFTHEPNYYETNADIYSTSAILDTLMCVPMTVKYAGTPITWEELASMLQTVQFIMWWVLRWRCANFLKCFNFTPFSTNGSTGHKINVGISQGSIFAALKALADMYDVNVGSRSDGEIISQSLPWMLSDRSGVATRCALVNNIYSDIKVTWQRRSTYGSVIHDGVVSDLVTDTPVAAQMPGLQTFGQGGNIERKSNKVYESQSDNKNRAGFAYAYLNSQYPHIEVDIRNNWDVFEPADCNLVTVVIPANKSPTGSAITIDCVPESIDKTWIGGQRAAIKMTLVASTNGLAAQTVPPSPTAVVSLTPPIFNIPPQLPTIGDGGGSIPFPVTPGIGDELFTASGSKSYWLTHAVTLTTPQYNLITPTLGAFTINDIITDPNPTPGSAGGYILQQTGGSAGSSAIQHAPSLPAISPIWTLGTVFGGNYLMMRGMPNTGGVMVYSPDPTGGDIVFDFTTSAGSWTDAGSGLGTWQNGIGWVDTYAVGSGPGSGGLSGYRGIIISLTTTGDDITQFSVDYVINVGTYDSTATNDVFVNSNAGGPQTQPAAGSGTYTIYYNAAFTGATNYQIVIVSGISNGPTHPDPGGNVTVTRAEIKKAGTNGSVRYSPDYGVTIGSPVDLGSSPGAVGGFDVLRYGSLSYASANNLIRKATSAGGAYSDFYSITGGAQAVAIHIPYFNWAGNDQTNSATPDVIIALNQLDGSSRSLLWVEGNGSTVHDITPHAGMVFVKQDCVVTHLQGDIACFGLAAGVQALYVTTDKGTTWIKVKNLSRPTWLGERRNNDIAKRGQLYLLDNGQLYYSSHWGANGMALHNIPSQSVADTVW